MAQKPTDISSVYDEELAYWRQNYAARSLDEIMELVSARRRLEGRVLDAIEHAPGRLIRLLDVGCGPVSVLGWSDSQAAVELHGIDPLADAYRELLAEYGAAVPYTTHAIGAEEIRSAFKEDSFDYVFSRSSIEQTVDAAQVIENMLAVTKEGGTVELDVFENESVAAGYSGLHRWNFCQLDDQIIVWNRSKAVLLDTLVSPYPYAFETMPKPNDSGRKQIIVKIHKRGPSNLAHRHIEDTVDIYHDLPRRIVQLRSLQGDRTKKLFVHTQGVDVEGVPETIAKTYTWPADAEHLNIRLPQMQEISSVAIGEYEVELDEDGRRYINHWREIIS